MHSLLTGDLEDRLAAVPKVGRTDDDRVVEALIDLAQTPAVGGRELEAVAAALGRTGHENARAYLRGRLASENPGDREFTAIALGDWRDRESISTLIGLLEDPVNSVRNIAERSLMNAIEATREHGTDDLLRLLEHPVPLTRSPAARLLGLARAPEALQPLLRQLHSDRQWLARMWAAKGLGDLGDPIAVDPLVNAFRNDEKNRVRAAAIEAIAKLAPANVTELLQEALTDEDGGVKRLAEEWLLKLRRQ